MVRRKPNEERIVPVLTFDILMKLTFTIGGKKELSNLLTVASEHNSNGAIELRKIVFKGLKISEERELIKIIDAKDEVDEIKKKIYKLIQTNTGLPFQIYMRNEINDLLEQWKK
jgi:hypothetical protein